MPLSWKLVLLGLAAGLAAGWLGYPRLAAVTITQPIRFSHSVHAKQDVACSTCHAAGTNASGSASGVLPSIAVCAGCHTGATGGRSEDAREIDKLFSEYVEKDREVPWLVLARQPGHVLFVHGPHQDLPCDACHPDMARQDYPELRRDRISGYTNWTMSMARCRSCHQERKAAVDCVVCHR